MDWLDRKHQKTTWNHWSSHEINERVSCKFLLHHHSDITISKIWQPLGIPFSIDVQNRQLGIISVPFSPCRTVSTGTQHFWRKCWSSWKKAHSPCNIFLLGVYSPLRSKLAMRGSDLPRLCYICKSPYGTFFLFCLSLSLSSILNCCSLHELPDTMNTRSNLQVQFSKYSTTNTHTHNASLV